MNIKNKKNFPFKRLSSIAAMGVAALAFAACDNGGDLGGPDGWAEDPHEDTDNPPPAPGTVGESDPAADPQNQPEQPPQ
jgi:hypothetical protein